MTKFNERAKAHVRKIFRVRTKLLEEHKSLANTTTLKVTLERIERLFNYYPYNTDAKMAMFIKNHMAELMFLTPAHDSNCHAQMMNDLNSIYDESIKILSTHEHTSFVH